MPVLLQSSQTEFGAQAAALGAGFIAKNSKTLLSQLAEFIEREFAFGDFLPSRIPRRVPRSAARRTSRRCRR